MTVYVDEPKYRYRRMIMCHMIADTEGELLLMADLIGVKTRWYQQVSIPHFDVCKAKRAQAIKLGAVEVTSRELVRIARAAQTRPPTDCGEG